MFENAKWITGFIECDREKKYEPVIIIARTFEIDQLPEKAMLHVIGFGEAAYFVNGKRIEKAVRPTFPTVPEKTLIYTSYDITDMLRKGKNRIGAMLSHDRCWEPSDSLHYKKKPEAVLQLDFDGKEFLVSDSSFKFSPSHITFSYFECGEIHDANLICDWSNPEFDDSGWKQVSEEDSPGGEYRPLSCENIVKYDSGVGVEINPKLFYFGKNTSGCVRVRVSGKKGAVIKLNYSERLLPDSPHVDMSTFQKSIKPYPDMYNSDEFILSGNGIDTFEDLFSIHGFRYVEVIGEYDFIELTAVTAHTDLHISSSFECENETLNRIHDSCIQSIKTCCQGFFVDNPKRDASWTGDLMLASESVVMNFDSYRVLLENMLLCRDTVREDGNMPWSVPYGWSHLFIGPEWTHGVLFFVPYYCYKYFGKREIVDSMWDSMNAALGFFPSLGDGGYLIYKNGTGDWVPVKGGCSLEVAMTVYYRLCALMTAELAEATGRDAEEYTRLAENIRVAYREKYVHDGKVKASHITEYILPAATGMLERDECKCAAETIAEMIRADGFSLTSGVHGMKYVFDFMTEYGYGDLMLKVLLNDSVPGFAKNANDGIGTLPEKFKYAEEPVISLNHMFMSFIDTWLFKHLAGIQIDGFGFEKVKISPMLHGDVGYFKASLFGITVEYDGKTTLKVDSPYGFTLDIRGKIGEYAAGTYSIAL